MMRERVLLCVDDERSVLQALRRVLRREPYQIVTATGGQEGLALLQTQRVQVVVSDQRMPEMAGTEFLEQVKIHYPETVRVILSGYAEVYAIIDAINKAEVYRFLPKPWQDEELKYILQECFEQYDRNKLYRKLLSRFHDQKMHIDHGPSPSSRRSRRSP